MLQTLGLLGVASILAGICLLAIGLVLLATEKPRTWFVVLALSSSLPAFLGVASTLMALRSVNAAGALPPEALAEGRQSAWSAMWAGGISAIPALAIGILGMRFRDNPSESTPST